MRFGGMMAKVISIWSEENSPERIVMCLTNSGTEVIIQSSIVELSLTDLVGELISWNQKQSNKHSINIELKLEDGTIVRPYEKS